MKSPEGYEKDDICKFLDKIKAWYFRPYMAGFGKAGIPDIIACIQGRFVGIEVKRHGKTPTLRQLRRMEEIICCKGIAVAGTAEMVIKRLEELFGAI